MSEPVIATIALPNIDQKLQKITQGLENIHETQQHLATALTTLNTSISGLDERVKELSEQNGEAQREISRMTREIKQIKQINSVRRSQDAASRPLSQATAFSPFSQGATYHSRPRDSAFSVQAEIPNPSRADLSDDTMRETSPPGVGAMDGVSFSTLPGRPYEPGDMNSLSDNDIAQFRASKRIPLQRRVVRRDFSDLQLSEDKDDSDREEDMIPAKRPRLNLNSTKDTAPAAPAENVINAGGKSFVVRKHRDDDQRGPALNKEMRWTLYSSGNTGVTDEHLQSETRSGAQRLRENLSRFQPRVEDAEEEDEQEASASSATRAAGTTTAEDGTANDGTESSFQQFAFDQPQPRPQRYTSTHQGTRTRRSSRPRATRQSEAGFINTPDFTCAGVGREYGLE